MKDFGVIYLVTNLVNNKKYVGQTTRDLKTRWIEHKSKSSHCKRLRNAIWRNGEDKFKMEILEHCSSKEELDHKEKYWIKKFNSNYRHLGYNIVKNVIAG